MAYSATLQRTRRQSLGHFLSSRNFMQGIIKKADAVQSLQQQSAMPGPDKKRRRKKSLISGAERTKQWREIANKPAKIRHISPANPEGTIKGNIFTGVASPTKRRGITKIAKRIMETPGRRTKSALDNTAHGAAYDDSNPVKWLQRKVPIDDITLPW